MRNVFALLERRLTNRIKIGSRQGGGIVDYGNRNFSSMLLKGSIEGTSTISSANEFNTEAMRLRKKLCLG